MATSAAYHQATAATADTPPEMVTGALLLGPRKKHASEPDAPTVLSKQSSLAEDLPPTANHSSLSVGRPDTSKDGRSLHSVGQSETRPLISDDQETKPYAPQSSTSACLSKKHIGIIIAIFIVTLVLVVVVIILAVLPQDIHASMEVYNVNNDTVLAVQFDRSKHNAVTLKHVQRDIVHTHTIHVYSQNCKTLPVYDQTNSHMSNHSINVSQHTLVSPPTYLLPGSRMEFNITILNVPFVAAEIYLYMFNDLNLLFTYFYEQNYAYRSQVYTHGSGVQRTTTAIEYSVTEQGYWFAAIVCDTPIEMEYSSRFYKVLYDRSKLQEKCILEDVDSCELHYSFTSTFHKECVLCYASAPAVTTPDPAYVTATVTKWGETPPFYGVLGVLISFCIVVVFLITWSIFVRPFILKCTRTPLHGKS